MSLFATRFSAIESDLPLYYLLNFRQACSEKGRVVSLPPPRQRLLHLPLLLSQRVQAGPRAAVQGVQARWSVFGPERAVR